MISIFNFQINTRIIPPVVFAMFLFFIFPFSVRAATDIYLVPAEKTVGPGSVFETEIRVDVSGECVNTFEVGIDFDASHLQLMDFLTGDSFLSIWLQKPDSSHIPAINREGTIRFSGGIPGGYCGRLPGDPGDSNILGRLIFRVPTLIVDGGDKTELNIDFQDITRVLINDGLGTDAMVMTRGAKLEFVERSIRSDATWRERISQDNIPPEPFVVELHRRNDIFNGDYYLIFDTQDKQSGVDHYAVIEIGPGQSAGIPPKFTWWDRLLGRSYSPAVWKKAQINYRLEDQSLNSIIRVKAVDKAGNERVVEFIPPADLRAELKAVSQKRQNMLLLTAAAAAIIVLLLFFLIYFWRRRAHRRRHQNNYEDHTEDRSS